MLHELGRLYHDMGDADCEVDVYNRITAADPLDIGWSFSATGWLAVLLLFVLARVFNEGAEMRYELEGTV